MEHLRAASHRALSRRTNRGRIGALAFVLTAVMATAGCSTGFQARDLAGADTGTGTQPERSDLAVAGPATTATTASPPAAPTCVDAAPSVATLQKGTTRLTGTVGVTVSTMAVAPERAILLFSARGVGEHPADVAVRGRLVADATLEFTRAVDLGTPTTVEVEWSLVEFACGVRVQRGDVTVEASTSTTALTETVAPDRSFVLWSSTAAATAATATAPVAPAVELADPTTLRVAAERAAGQQLSWQLVEFLGSSGGRVHTARATFAADAATVSLPLPSPVDPTRSVVLVGPATPVPDAGAAAAAATDGADATAWRPVTARLDGPSDVSVERAATGAARPAEAVVQVVELPGATVVRGTVDVPAGSAAITVDAAGFDPAHSVAFLSAQGATGQSSGVVAGVAVDRGDGGLTATVTEGRLLLRRASTDGAVRGDWAIVSWQ